MHQSNVALYFNLTSVKILFTCWYFEFILKAKQRLRLKKIIFGACYRRYAPINLIFMKLNVGNIIKLSFSQLEKCQYNGSLLKKQKLMSLFNVRASHVMIQYIFISNKYN